MLCRLFGLDGFNRPAAVIRFARFRPFKQGKQMFTVISGRQSAISFH
jgi:hypothetical protein